MEMRAQPQQGFTLAEVAIALSIIALAIGLLVPMVLGMRTAEQGRATNKNLEIVMQATAAYVQAHGCVPCPVPFDRVHSAGHGTVRGDASANPAFCSDACLIAVGSVPFRSLGISESFSRDGYGSWLTYAVDITLTQDFSVSTASDICRSETAGCTAEDVANARRARGMCRAGLSTANRLQVYTYYSGPSVEAAALVLSHGANRYGAFNLVNPSVRTQYAFPSTRPPCSVTTVQGAERCNAEGTRNFFDLPSAEGDDGFDDQLLYLGRNALVSYLGGASCQSTW